MRDRPDWFAPKRFGLGSGLPVCWQGWIVTALYAALLIAASAAFGHKPIVLVALIIPVTMLFIIICAHTTRGGWRWRWGEEE